MNNQWRVFHLPHASCFLLRKMLLEAYSTLLGGMTAAERETKLNVLASILSKDALIAECELMLRLLERRNMCCLSFPPVPYIAVRLVKEDRRFGYDADLSLRTCRGGVRKRT